ncbi:MAG: filamentous hemagglutinin N-terminal domain-containing protein [Pyrinomonadaceae bacterium]|nr:filamentous hemagglutinin N-terminal domain-containing protein [Pyrinomonadaceae bacterium]
MTVSSLTVILCGSLLVVTSVGQGHAAAPITPSGLNTQVNLSATPPAGHVQYDITGGTRPGGGANLFHSFGDFSVPTNNIANFLNAGSIDVNGNVLASNLPTSNILGRVTGGDPSAIFGMIQTNGPNGFGTANLFLMNPAGFLFGPNATVNVGGMVAFTSADYLRLNNGVLFNATPNAAADALLSAAPVAAFGFLGSNAAAIAIQGSTLTVAPGQSISLVGGNRGFEYTDPDTGHTASTPVPGGVTMTGGTLSASGGQINLASVASPGEIMFPDLQIAPNINGQSFTAMGNISLSQEALLDVSGNAGGSVKIRGGQLVINQATISADTSDADGAVGIDINVTGIVSLSNTNLPALTAKTSGAGDAGDIVISSGSLNATFGKDPFTDPFHVSLIDSDTTGSGHGGNVTITTGALSATKVPSLENGNFILSGTGGDGKGGDVTITAGDAQFTSINIDTGGATTFFGPGAAGNLTVKAQSLILDNVTWGIDSMSRAGSINMESAGLLSIGDGSIISSQSSLGNNPITIKADRFVLDNNTQILATTVFENGGDVSVTSRTVEFSNSGLIATQTFGDGNAGNIIVRASEQVSFIDNPTMPTSLPPSGLYTTSLGGAGNFGNAGNITVTTPRLELFTGARINASTFTSGEGGNVNITNANSVLVTGERSSLFGVEEQFVPGGTNASGIYTSTLGSEFCTGACGSAGNINIATGSSVTISDHASVSASSTGTGDTGNIQINAGNLFEMTNHSSVTTEANLASGGLIKITTTPNGTVQLTDSTISASVLDGAGGGGNVNIDPQFVILQNSQILAQAKQGPGGNISITTNRLLPDANSVISASSEFGVNGTVTIQSPNAPGSGQVQPLGKTPLLPTSLLNQHCAALAGGEFSSFTVAGRDSLPTEPGSWLASPLYAAGVGEGLGVRGDGIGVRGAGIEGMTLGVSSAGETPLLSLRQIAPAGFLTQAFAEDRSLGCTS